jgi:hypothetical protein
MIFYRSFYEALKELPTTEKAEIYDAIFSYSLDFTENDLAGISKSIFTLIKPQLDANLKRYENGKKPKVKTEANDKQTISKTEANELQIISKTVTNVNDNVNDNNNKNDNQNNNVLLIKETKPKKNFEDRKLEFRDKLHEIMIVESVDKNMVKEFYLYWTEQNQSNTKMRFELEKTYDITRRLSTWIKNADKFSTNKNINNGIKTTTRTDIQNSAKEQFRQNFSRED